MRCDHHRHRSLKFFYTSSATKIYSWINQVSNKKLTIPTFCSHLKSFDLSLCSPCLNKKQCPFLVSGGPFCVYWIFLSMNNRRRHRGEIYQHQEVQRTTRSRSTKPPHHGMWSSLPLIFLRPCTRSYFAISFKHYLISFKRVVSCWILSWKPLFWCYCSS